MNIPFNKPYLSGKELEYITDSVRSGKISGDGKYTKKVHDFFENELGFQKSLMTTSCTDALEMAAILCEIQSGDEVIAPSYTFVSTVNAFVLRGAKLVFADSMVSHPNIDTSHLESLITSRTKAIIAVHYAGVACDMGEIMSLAKRYHLFVIEDAAQAIDSQYKGQTLGSIGHFGAFSFHETKNVISGEGGLLTVNTPKYNSRAEVIREKGTNRSQFFRGEVDKYGWTDVGSSFLPSDIISAYLFAQLEKLEDIQSKRKMIWNKYFDQLQFLLEFGVDLPQIPDYATNNAHMFYLVCLDLNQRAALINYLKSAGIHAVFHYQALHKSPYYCAKHDDRSLTNCDKFTDQLVRLPLFYELSDIQQQFIIEKISDFFMPIKRSPIHARISSL